MYSFHYEYCQLLLVEWVMGTKFSLTLYANMPHLFSQLCPKMFLYLCITNLLHKPLAGTDLCWRQKKWRKKVGVQIERAPKLAEWKIFQLPLSLLQIYKWTEWQWYRAVPYYLHNIPKNCNDFLREMLWLQKFANLLQARHCLMRGKKLYSSWEPNNFFGEGESEVNNNNRLNHSEWSDQCVHGDIYGLNFRMSSEGHTCMSNKSNKSA